MTTTVELTDFELSELCEATHQPNAEAAIRTAMTEYLRSVRDCRRSANEPPDRVEPTPTANSRWTWSTFSVSPNAPLIPGDRAAQLLAEEGP